jgi:hypothetical protein
MGGQGPGDVGQVEVVVGDESAGVVLGHFGRRKRSRKICRICIDRWMYSMMYMWVLLMTRY